MFLNNVGLPLIDNHIISLPIKIFILVNYLKYKKTFSYANFRNGNFAGNQSSYSFTYNSNIIDILHFISGYYDL